MSSGTRNITITVNGRQVSAEVEPRLTLADFLRDRLDLTGVHLGCEHGVCGCCTVLLDGRSVRSCLMFAVQASDHEVETVESLSADVGSLHPIQEAFWDEHALQCGFCTPAMMLRTKELIARDGQLSRDEIREQLSGILCRCTGYQNIVNAVIAARDKMNAPAGN
jgi:carbon-monoxide dehydrogenase small subunit